MESRIEKWHFEKLEAEPEMQFICDYCGDKIFEDGQKVVIPIHLQDGSFTKFPDIEDEICKDCYSKLSKEIDVDNEMTFNVAMKRHSEMDISDYEMKKILRKFDVEHNF